MTERKMLRATAGPVCIAPGVMHSGPSQTESKGKTGISSRRLNNPVNLAREKSFEVRFRDLGCDAINTNAIYGLGKQIGDIDPRMTLGAKGLITFPVDSREIGPLVQRTETAGILAAGLGISIENSDVCMSHPAESWRMGEMMCEYLMPVTKNEKTLCITGNFSNFVGRHRYNGFINYMKRYYPNIEVSVGKAKIDGSRDVVDVIRKGDVDTTIVADDVVCKIFRFVNDNHARWKKAKEWTEGARFEYRQSQLRSVAYSDGIGGDERRH